MDEHPRIVSKVYDARKQKGMTLEALARKANVSKEAIRKIEKGISIPNVLLAMTLATILGWTLGELFKPIQKGDESHEKEGYSR